MGALDQIFAEKAGILAMIFHSIRSHIRLNGQLHGLLAM